MLIQSLNLRDAGEVERTLLAGAEALRRAPGRRGVGSVEVVERPAGIAPIHLIATGDLHDNPLHLARLLAASGLDGGDGPIRRHLTLHELIHADRLVGGLDYSYRVLTRVAALKAAHPDLVHPLLANHELAQLGHGAGIVKDGVRVVEAFNDAIDLAFCEEAGRVRAGVAAFIRALPLALRVRAEDGDILCAHSLPGPELMDRFDAGVLERDLSEEDYVPRRGSAHLLVWGRGHTPEQIEELGERWGVKLFILGHEKAESGALVVSERALVLNSDHEHGVYLPLELGRVPTAPEAARSVVALNPER